MRVLLITGLTLTALSLPPVSSEARGTGPTGPTGASGHDVNGAIAAPAATASADCSIKQDKTAETRTVRIGDFCFSPITATVHVGDTVTWVNRGSQVHNATACDGPYQAGDCAHPTPEFHTKDLKPGAKDQVKLTERGTFEYVCSIHPAQMHATIKVLASSSARVASSTTGGIASPSTTSASSSGTSSSSPSPVNVSASIPVSATSSTTPAVSTTSGSGGSLPASGLDLVVLLLIGANLVLGGFVLRGSMRTSRL